MVSDHVLSDHRDPKSSRSSVLICSRRAYAAEDVTGGSSQPPFRDRVGKRHGSAVLVGVTHPLTFADIGEVLIPFRVGPDGGSSGLPDRSGNPLLNRLDPHDGHRLLAPRGDLVCASDWMAEANEVVAPRLGLPALPLVGWPDVDEEPSRGVHWKTAPLTRWAAGQPFVWLDDETTDADRRWVAAHHPEPALLHRVDPFVGLADTDLTEIHQWLDQLNKTA